jgi:uncharacterized protein
MALELRPNCELCDCDLAANSPDARICSYECTFCASCAEGTLKNVCPNCGGGFVPRPIRPKHAWRSGVSLQDQPAGTKRRKVGYSMDDIAAHTAKVRDIPPSDR